MTLKLSAAAAVSAMLVAVLGVGTAFAQKQGGILRAGHFDSPASMSLLEESTLAVNRPIMGVFNNLVMFDQEVAQNSPQSIVPDLATGWSWNEEGTELTMPLRHGVKWHDGRAFTAQDVKCTWDLLTGRGNEKLRISPRKSWYDNLDAVTSTGDFEVTFHLKRPQPSFLTLLASGWSPVYPCHVPARDMRLHPIGTGPFKFVEFKPNQSITVTRNPDYWKPGRPYLDGLEWAIVKDTSTRLLSFFAGQADVYFGVTIPQLHDVKREVPDAICDGYLVNGSRNLIVNRGMPPFDNPDLRHAMSLTLDRQAFIDIIGQGQGAMGGPMEPPPEGLWGMPADMLKALPGYGPDVAQRRIEARQIMEKLDFTVGLNVTESEVDDPDAQFYENYKCGGLRNYTGYCSKPVDELIERQSREANADKRRQLVWQIEKRLIEEDARPDILYVPGVTCRRPYVNGLISMVNSIYNGSRFEDVRLDQ